MSATSIQDQALARYHHNLAFFQAKYPDVYKKIFLLDTAIAQGQYKERYALEYNKEGYFDVKQITTNAYLYGQHSERYAQYAAQNVTYKKNDSVIFGYYQYTFSKEVVDYYKTSDVRQSMFSATASIIYHTSQQATPHTTMKSIYKYIFLGTGLGTHLPKIDEKIRARVYLIVEDDLELFRLSLFVTDYTSLGEHADLFFAIAESRERFDVICIQFLKDAFLDNHYLKYFAFTESYYAKIKQIQTLLLTQSHITYPYSNRLNKISLVLERVQKRYKFLNIAKKYDKTFLSDKPVVLVAAGPSLEQNIEWLTENQDKYIIVALFMTLAVLKKAGISPDIIIHIDEQSRPIETIKAKVQSFDFVKNAVCIFAPSVSENLLSLFDQDNIFFIEDLTRYKDSFGHIEGFSVGEVAYVLLLLWNFQNIYLLGLDLALDPQSGHTHIQEHSSGDKRVVIDARNDTFETNATLRETILYTKGNFIEQVPTTPLFYISIQKVNEFTKKYKSNSQTVYNLSNGAYFDNVISKKAQDIDQSHIQSLSKAMIRSEVLTIFKKRSSDQLTKDEVKKIENALDKAKVKKSMIEEFGTRKLASVDNFRKQYKLLISKLIVYEKAEEEEFSKILYAYSHYIGEYIIDFLNTKEIVKPKKVLQDLKHLIVEELLRVVDLYILLLEDFLKKQSTL